VHLSVIADGTRLGVSQIAEPAGDFRRQYILPERFVGQPTLDVDIEVDRVFHSPDGRDLSLIFGLIRIGRE
jgi:hypothetical protein